MVRVELIHHGEAVAIIEAQDDGQISVDGPGRQLVDLHAPQLGLLTGRPVTSDGNAEDWARGLTIAFRSVDLFARIAQDDAQGISRELLDLPSAAGSL